MDRNWKEIWCVRQQPCRTMGRRQRGVLQVLISQDQVPLLPSPPSPLDVPHGYEQIGDRDPGSFARMCRGLSGDASGTAAMSRSVRGGLTHSASSCLRTRAPRDSRVSRGGESRGGEMAVNRLSEYSKRQVYRTLTAAPIGTPPGEFPCCNWFKRFWSLRTGDKSKEDWKGHYAKYVIAPPPVFNQEPVCIIENAPIGNPFHRAPELVWYK